MHNRLAALTVLLLVFAVLASACSGSGSLGTLTPVAADELNSVYEEIVGPPESQLPTAVSQTQVQAGDATGWQYLLEEDASPRVELKVYQDGEYRETVTVLPGVQSLNGTILFGASASADGYIWATDLHDGSQTGSHRFTYQASPASEPRRLAAGTVDLQADQEVWLAALLYDIGDDYKPTDIAALQQSGLSKVPLAAVLTLRFDSPDADASR